MLAKLRRKTVPHLRSIGSVFNSRLAKGGVAAGYYNVDNFGDLLTPDLLAHVGLRSFHCQKFKYTDCVGVGSILHKLPDDYKGAVLGSGFICEEDIKVLPHAKIYLVRGHLTRKGLGLPDNLPVGDPGLLASDLYGVKRDPPCSNILGFIPHYSDVSQPSVQYFLKQCGPHIRLIDVRKKPAEVVRKIAECSHIVSSSLHGLIVADSLGIPARGLGISNKVLGEGFKFRDYHSCFGEDPEMIAFTGKETVDELVNSTRLAEPDRVEEVKSSIQDSFERFAIQH
ncbi:polysaccharide pyruvyl transferase family protein [Akkermansiaceae bacterium]|nr:polysaccharide pyruvyl transferase family protein [Akkermansiaceae bacterium]